eukprot:2349303-Pyramimonas_sp.AAC.1
MATVSASFRQPLLRITSASMFQSPPMMKWDLQGAQRGRQKPGGVLSVPGEADAVGEVNRPDDE